MDGSDRASRTISPIAHGRDLVAGAIASIAALQTTLPKYVAGTASGGDLRAALDRADLDGDNLLRSTTEDGAPRLLASLERGGDGTRLHAAVLALEPATMTLSTADGRGPLDRLLEARDGDIDGRVRALEDRLAAAASALSVAASRLALQASFVDAILEEDEPLHPSVPGVPSLDAASAREAALAVGAMLSLGPMPIAGGNRRTLDQLFATMASGDAAT